MSFKSTILLLHQIKSTIYPIYKIYGVYGGCVVMEQKTGIRTENNGIHLFQI